MHEDAKDHSALSATRWTMITVAYNNAKTLRDHWEAIRPDDVEWIVVDNASSDASVETAEALGAKVISLERNLGFSAANNAALAVAKGDYVAFVNPDVVVDWQSLDRLAATIDKYDAFVAPQLLNPDGSVQPNGRGAPSLIRKLRNRLAFNDNDGYHVTAKRNELIYVAWCIGAAVAAKRDTVLSMGGWDDSYFIYYEDADFCLRAWKSGSPVIVDGGANWIHSWDRATSRFRIGPWKREFASAQRFYRREVALLISHKLDRRNHNAFAKSGKLLSEEATA